MSAADLYLDQQMITFVWGDGCDVEPDKVRLQHYKFTQMPQNYLNNTIPMSDARRYWKRLVREGYRLTLTDYSHVPEVHRPDWPAKMRGEIPFDNPSQP